MGAVPRPPRDPRDDRAGGERRGPAKPGRPGATRPQRDPGKPDSARAERRDDAPRRGARPGAPARAERSSPSRTNRARVHREERAEPEFGHRAPRGGDTRGERAPAPRFGRAGARSPERPSTPRPTRPVASRERPRAVAAPERAPVVDDEPMGVHRPGEPQRIAKLLARAGIASRREIERMIADKRIALDGTIIDTPATILTSLQGVTVDGKPVRAPSATRLFLFHKPAGYLTAANDPAGRPTIYDRLPPGLPRLVPVGRLDLNTEGLLLLTNDGEFKRQLELPSTGIVRSYRARVFGDVSQAQLEELIHGVEIEGMRYGPIDANLERRTGRNGWVEMRLTEGKNREVRRVLEHLELQVSRLIRTSYGEFVLGDLPVGGVAEVLQHDLVAFRKTLK